MAEGAPPVSSKLCAHRMSEQTGVVRTVSGSIHPAWRQRSDRAPTGPVCELVAGPDGVRLIPISWPAWPRPGSTNAYPVQALYRLPGWGLFLDCRFIGDHASMFARLDPGTIMVNGAATARSTDELMLTFVLPQPFEEPPRPPGPRSALSRPPCGRRRERSRPPWRPKKGTGRQLRRCPPGGRNALTPSRGGNTG